MVFNTLVTTKMEFLECCWLETQLRNSKNEVYSLDSKFYFVDFFSRTVTLKLDFWKITVSITDSKSREKVAKHYDFFDNKSKDPTIFGFSISKKLFCSVLKLILPESSHDSLNLTLN